MELQIETQKNTDAETQTAENLSLSTEKPKKNYLGYITIFISQYFSLIGSQIVSFAVIWYLTITTESSLILSLATFANLVPMIIISPIAGVIADKFSKNFILIFTDALQAVATLGLIILFYLGIFQIWQIILLMGVRGICQGFQMPVSVAVTSLMVPDEKIKKINAIQQILSSLLMISTPAIGAYLVNIFPIEQIYWLDVFSFIPTAIVLLVIKIPKVSGDEQSQKMSFKKDFSEGMKYIKDSGLMPVFFYFAIANFIVVPIFSLLPLLIVDHHLGTATEYGITEIMFHVGLLLGSFILIASKKKSTMKSVVTFGVLLSVSVLLMAIVPKGVFWLFYITCGILGVVLAFIDTQLISVLQVNIPKELQGRVFSTMFTLIKSINPVGLVIWGILGQYISIYLIFILSPVISLVIYFILLKSTEITHYGEK
ncbi:MFS transporter [Promethearchaeum syntrophicum]|uniref:MFS transporter n=1 Tax=Promethearchaeum syntrophicum TaxID=2594042 RepID=A0A5B9D7N9_9ARCH|nr:MFS transporter [Candidatus Prometheoarchaeum syntrophicum]QEE15228.1 enterobactin exporter EntS [Candidatus Prometheoarchaeum syntrophicum]